MPEYIVDCKHRPYGEGKTLILPYGTVPHVHERIIRCCNCRFYDAEGGVCTYWSTYWTVDIRMFDPDGFCSLAEPKDGT